MTNNRTQGNQNFKQLEGDSWTSIYLPAICAGIVMTIVLFMAVSCSKKSDKPVSNISAPSAPTMTNSTPTTTAAVPEQPKKAAKKHRPANATYVNSAYGVSFSYPRKYSLQTGEQSAPVETNFVKQGAVQVAAVNMPDGSYPETDFSAALLNVSVVPQMSAEECAQFVAGSKDAGEVKPTTVKLGSNEFAEFEQINGVGDRNSDLKYFHLFKNGACYEFALDVDSTFKPESDLAQVDRGKVFHQLEKILASARINEVEMPGVESAEKAQATDASNPEAATQPQATETSKTEKAEVVTPEQK
jgi:hypothetical protein